MQHFYRRKHSFAILFVLTGCAARPDAADTQSVSYSAEFKGVNFESGRPEIGQSLSEALAAPVSKNLSALKMDADFLIENPELQVEILGFTDNAECRPQSCQDLSQRRAKAVHDWLIDLGVRESSLKPPSGLGSTMAIDDNETEEGRRRNRRVEVHLAIDSNK